MSTRFYDVPHKVEAFGPGPGVVELPADNPFFHPLPEGKQLTYDESGIPNGLEDRPKEVYDILEDNDLNFGPRRIANALLMVTRGDSSYLDQINAELDAISESAGFSIQEILGI